MSIDKRLLEGFITDESQPITKPSLQTIGYTLPPQLSTMTTASISDDYTNTSMDNLLKDLSGAKIMNTKEVINDIETLINQRQELQAEVFKDAEKILMNMNNFLSSAQDKISEAELVTIREKLLDVETFKMQEKINAFRDIATLKKELRDRMHEYREQEHNANVFEELLNG